MGIKELLTGFLILCLVGCDSSREKENAENLEKVNKGMGMKKVISIMGEPEEMHNPPLDKSTTEFVYSSPTGMSDHYRIRVSKRDSTVVFIGDGL